MNDTKFTESKINMLKEKSTTHKLGVFTLIELLVVIVIISILATLPDEMAGMKLMTGTMTCVISSGAICM